MPIFVKFIAVATLVLWFVYVGTENKIIKYLLAFCIGWLSTWVFIH